MEQEIKERLVSYFEENPPKGYVPMLDDVDLIYRDMVEYVEGLTDKEIKMILSKIVKLNK